MKDLVNNTIKVGELCWYLKAGTQVQVALVEIVEFKPTGVVCRVVENNPSGQLCRGCYWEEGYITKPLENTNLIRCNVSL